MPAVRDRAPCVAVPAAGHALSLDPSMLRASRASAASTIHASTTPIAAVPMCPSPIATLTAAVIQMPAAVVSPLIR